MTSNDLVVKGITESNTGPNCTKQESCGVTISVVQSILEDKYVGLGEF